MLTDTARDEDPAIAAAEDESRAALAYRKLEEMIVTLKLAPGAAITETSLAAALGMGRTPIREAVQRLSWEGLLTIRPRLGIVVSEINPGDFARVLDARHAVEVLLTGAAARFASCAERDVLADCAEAMRDAAAANDVLGFMARDKQFDEVVAVAACNPFAARVAAPLQTHSRRFWYRYFGDSDLSAAAFHHMELMRAIGAGNEPRATAKAEELMQYLRRQSMRLVADIDRAERL